MPRYIKDELITRRAKGTNKGEEFLEYFHDTGFVESKLNKIVFIGEQCFLLEESSVTSRLEANWQISKSEEEAFIELNEKNQLPLQMFVEKEMIDLLKSLALEQVSKNEAYSKVIADIWFQVVKTLLSKKENITISIKSNYTIMQKKVLEEVVNFIRNKIKNRAVYMVEELRERDS